METDLGEEERKGVSLGWRCSHVESRAGKEHRERVSDQFVCKWQGGERGKACGGDYITGRLCLPAALPGHLSIERISG